jgi:hypothetical protein
VLPISPVLPGFKALVEVKMIGREALAKVFALSVTEL